MVPGIVLAASAVSMRRDSDLGKSLTTSWWQYDQHSSRRQTNGTMRKNNKPAYFSKRLESHCPKVLIELLEIRASTSYAYIMDSMDIVQSETSSSTSWKRILGIERVTIALDRYDNGESIKTPERQRRGSLGAVIRHLGIIS